MRVPDNTLPSAAGGLAWQTETSTRHLGMQLPCGHFANLPVEGPKAWQWDGNLDAPSLTPSILCCPGECNWHGYMTNGELKSV